MSYFDDASLVMIPSGYKTSKVYSVKPTDGTGDLAFTRSNDTATRVASSGLIEKVRTNLILRSEAFDNASWTKSGVGTFTSAITTGFTDPTGGTDAQRWLATIGSVSDRAFVRQLATLTNGIPYAISFWVKSNTGSSQDIYFMFQGGAVQATTATTSWQRISYSATTSTTSVLVGIEAKDLAIDVLIYGFQLESGDIMTDYIATTTASVSVGPVANVPRLDYLNSSCPRLLLEPQRTNLATYSEQANQYTKAAATIGSNVVTSPDGYTNADSIIEDGTTAGHAFYNFGLTTFTAAAYTASVFAKKGGRDWFALSIYDSTVSHNAYFNLNTGTIGNVGAGATATITNYGNGWYRCSVTATTAALSGGIAIYAASVDGTVSYAGTNGLAAGYFYGWQLELGAYATSYIPTLGASVTRGADAATTASVPSLIGQTEGTIFIEYNRTNTFEAAFFMLSNLVGTTTNAYQNSFYFLQQANGTMVVEVYVASAPQVLFTVAALSVGTHKMALAYKANDFALYVDGVQLGTDTSGSVPTANFLSIGGAVDGGSQKQSVSQALLFKTRLSSADLAALTA